MNDPTLPTKPVPRDGQRALEWIAQTPALEIMYAREANTLKLEERARELRDSGECAAWLDACQVDRAIIQDVNGPLLCELLCDLGYHDQQCMELFETGANILQLMLYLCKCVRHHFRRSAYGRCETMWSRSSH